MILHPDCSFFFFFNDTATTEIYTLSLHDALPISRAHGKAEFLPNFGRCANSRGQNRDCNQLCRPLRALHFGSPSQAHRSEEHTSELQSLAYLVCRLLLEKKKTRPKMSPS